MSGSHARRRGIEPGAHHRGADPSQNGRSELGARVLAALPAVALALFLVVEGGIVFTLGVLVVGAVCLHELFSMFDRAHPVRLAGLLGLAAILLAAYYGGPAGNTGAKWILIAAVAMLPLTFALALMQSRQSALGVAITLFGLWWIGLGLAHAVLLRGLPHGLGVVIDVLVGTFVADTAAYFGGRLFGRRPLAVRISPNKTVEGLLIGMLSCIAAVWLASRYESWMPAGHALVLGLGIAVVGPIGDLFESFIKRQAAIKDSGSVFGAHGGALDRLDSLLFTAVVAFYIWSAYI